MLKNKKAEFGFVWIFAIIAGIAILMLMIYGASRIVDTNKNLVDTKLAKSLSIILDPLEAGQAETISSKIRFSKPTRLSLGCFEGGYGTNFIQISTESNLGKSVEGQAIQVNDKYIFSDAEDSKEEYYVFSKTFEYPYKIADIIILTSKKYCFLEAPSRVKSSYSGIEAITFDNCTGNEITVCFGRGVCNITVEGICEDINCETEFDYGFIRKGGQTIAYADSLLIAAIVSDKELYNCNVQRLMYRASKIADLLSKKAELATSRGCYTNLVQ